MTANMKEAIKLLLFVAGMALFGFVSPVGLNLIVFAVVLSFLVCIHELGHYIWFKRGGVKVKEFAIGMGPSIATFTFANGEQWSFRALLIGGYVSPQGAEKSRTDEQVPGDYWSATPWARMKAVLAGPLVNIVFAFIALTAALMLPTSHKLEMHVPEGSPLAAQGLEASSELIAVNGQPVETLDGYQAAVENTVEDFVTFDFVNSEGRYGQLTVYDYTPETSGFNVVEVRSGGPGYGPLKAASTSAGFMVDSVPRLFTAIKDMVTPSNDAPAADAENGDGAQSADEQPKAGMVGPSKFGETMRTQMQGGLFATLAIMASLSLILGISNLIPLLPLDGGHVVATAFELVGKPIPEKVQKLLSMMVGIPLFGLTIIWLFWDVIEKFI